MQKSFSVHEFFIEPKQETMISVCDHIFAIDEEDDFTAKNVKIRFDLSEYQIEISLPPKIFGTLMLKSHEFLGR